MSMKGNALSNKVDGVAFKKMGHAKFKGDGQGWIETDISDTLNIFDNSESRTPTLVYENHGQDCRYRPLGEVGQTVSATYGMGGNNQPLVVGGQEMAEEAVCIGNGQVDQLKEQAKVGALNCMHDQQAIVNHVVRRLTPTECERLQGYPDHWTDIGEWTDTKGKKHKDADSPRYKALGNSIALPFWEWMAARMVKYIDNEPTMASLFDGIGGFPLVFSRCGCRPVWASEIEEFPIAVTKIHFPEND